MSNSDQRLITGLKALAPGKNFWQGGAVSQGDFTAAEYSSLLSLQTLIQRHGEPLPEKQLLGICEEVLDLLGTGLTVHRPDTAIAPGSLLVIGDPGSGKTRLLRRLMISAAAHNTPEQAGFYLAAHQPAQFCDIGHLEHCRLVMQTYDRTLGAAVQELVDLAEERRAAKTLPGHAPASHPPGPTVILAIDDLASALLSLGEQSVTLLYWLIRHGPRQRVWTLATLSTRRLADLDLRFLQAFRSQVVGKISDPETAHMLVVNQGALKTNPGSFSQMQAAKRDLPRSIPGRELPTWTLEKGKQFFLPYGSSWVRFRLYEPRTVQCPGSTMHLWSGTA